MLQSTQKFFLLIRKHDGNEKHCFAILFIREEQALKARISSQPFVKDVRVIGIYDNGEWPTAEKLY